MAYNKVFFHAGMPCQGCNGLGTMWQRLDVAGIPFGIYSVDNGGIVAVDGARFARADPLIYRTTATDVAPYHLSPQGAAQQQWALLMSKLPPEVKALKARIWVEIGNEQDKTRADWLGHYYAELSAIALPQGYRICGPGWAMGEPEPADWETPGWLRYLRLCAASPGRLAVTLHEYSLNEMSIMAGLPWLVGRFQRLFDACDRHGIARPAVFVTELGWVLDNMPTPSRAMEDINTVAALYAGHPQIKAAFLWSLIGGGDKVALAQKLNGLIEPVTEYTLNVRWPDPPPPPPPTEATMILDLSKWNGTLDAAKMKSAGVQGVILRASYGANRDERVDDYAARLKAAGVPIIGAYHYYHPWEPWRPQLDTLKAVMAKHGLRRGYLDLEDSRVMATMARDAETFMAALAAEMPLPPGKRHGIYTNVAYWRNMGAPGWGNLYDLWIAAWTDVSSPIVPTPWQRWVLWQYSNSGDGPRYGLQSARVDLNRFNGTPAEYAEWLKIEAIPVDVAALIRADAATRPAPTWNPGHALPLAALRDGYYPFGEEYDITAGGATYRYIRAQSGSGLRRAYWCKVPDWGSVKKLDL